jgi:MFS family permease
MLIEKITNIPALHPLRKQFFRKLWISNSFSQVGGWMHDVGAAWLMTMLAPTPLMISLIQTASTLPMALLSLPAGALADIFDRKRLILATVICRIIVSAGLGLLVVFGYVTPFVLLAATFILGFAGAIGMPAWQSILPDIVSREEVPEAVTLNAVSFNMARGVGPAIGGAVVATMGSGGTFLLNATSLIWIATVLKSWKRKIVKSSLPEEEFIGAIRTGIRYVGNSQEIKSALIHTVAYVACGSAMWSLLPVVAKQGLGLSAAGYGMLLGLFGAGGIFIASLLSKIRKKFKTSHLNVASAIIFSFVLFAMAYGKSIILISIGMFLAGASWLSFLSTLMASLQSVTPRWVLGRVISVHTLVFFGSQAAGSAIWGFAANFAGLSFALASAGIVLLASLAFTYRYKLVIGENLDLRPYRDLTLAPIHTRHVQDEGLVLVAIDYIIDPKKARKFIRAMAQMKTIRRKYGSIRWTLFRDLDKLGYYRESFVVESWLEHLRQHGRFTVTDQAVLEKVHSLTLDGKPFNVDHYIAEQIPKITSSR